MLLISLISEFFQTIKAQKIRFFLTTFAIVWGTIAIVLMMAFGRGLKYRIVQSMLNAGNQIIRVYGGQTSMKYQGLPEGRWINFVKEDADLLYKTIPQIKEVSPSYGRWGVRLKNGDVTASTYCEGVYPNFELLRKMYPKKGGRFLNELDMKDKRRVIFLGSVIISELFGDHNPVGKEILLDGTPFTVIGVMQKKMQMGMSNGPDDRRAIIPFSTFEAMYPHRHLRMITVQPNIMTDTEVIKSRIYDVLGRKLRFDATDKNALHMWDFITNIKSMNSIFIGIEIFLGIIGGLTLIVAGVGIANIMYVVVKERTREIGIKKAIGARPRHIMMEFIFESVFIAFIGGIIGVIISFSIIKLIGMIPVNNEGLKYIGKPQLSQIILVLTAFILGTIGIIAGFFPAKKAVKMDPVESLRYE